MYQIGDLVVYGIHGVCRIAAEEQKTIDRKRVVYLVLEPVSQAASRFLVPSHNSAAMAKLRPLLKEAEFEGLLSSSEAHMDSWIPEEGRRKLAYRELIASADPLRLAGMVYTLYRHKARQLELGKKVHQSDDNFLRDGERIIAGELAIVMDVPYPEALAYLRQQLQT